MTAFNDGDDGILKELERLDRFLDGDDEGEVPLEVLRERGMEIPDEPPLDDQELHAKLWEVIEAMGDLGLLLDSTDHLTDAELYRYLVSEALLEKTLLPGEDESGFWCISPVGSGSEEDQAIYLAYYADDDERAEWHREWGDPLPPKQQRKVDRDRLLPGRR